MFYFLLQGDPSIWTAPRLVCTQAIPAPVGIVDKSPAYVDNRPRIANNHCQKHKQTRPIYKQG